MGLCPKPRSLSNWGGMALGKTSFPGARFPSWEPIAPSGLLGLLSSRALSVPAEIDAVDEELRGFGVELDPPLPGFAGSGPAEAAGFESFRREPGFPFWNAGSNLSLMTRDGGVVGSDFVAVIIAENGCQAMCGQRRAGW